MMREDTKPQGKRCAHSQEFEIKQQQQNLTRGENDEMM